MLHGRLVHLKGLGEGLRGRPPRRRMKSARSAGTTLMALDTRTWGSSPLLASSEAGIRITVGKFTLNVLYSLVLDYPDGSDRAIKDPRSVLFALASLVQANAERFGAIDHDLTIELSTRSGSETVLLTVAEDFFETPGHPTRKYVLLGETPAQADLSAQIVSAICGRYPSACGKPAAEKVTLFVCPAAPCDGQVAFGSFPSTSLTE